VFVFSLKDRRDSVIVVYVWWAPARFQEEGNLEPRLTPEQTDQKIIAVCRSPEFSPEQLRAAIEEYKSNSPNPQTSEARDEIKN